jgi:hypothetical protein
LVSQNFSSIEISLSNREFGVELQAYYWDLEQVGRQYILHV